MARALTAEERSFLLVLARRTLEARLGGLALPEASPPPGPLTEPRGAFVTLTGRDGALRGCIGHVEGAVPLWQSVRENAVAAALRDPRFPPVRLAELDELHLEISALSPLERAAPDAVEPGRHGVLVEHGFHRGLLLPQVATEYGWDRETFLDHTCRKAGLRPGCWQSADTRLWVFTAEVFGE